MLKYPVIEESRALSVSSPICFTRIPPVIHRTGGLEDRVGLGHLSTTVIHRTGGLEEHSKFSDFLPFVIHRTGGLEIDEEQKHVLKVSGTLCLKHLHQAHPKPGSALHRHPRQILH